LPPVAANLKKLKISETFLRNWGYTDSGNYFPLHINLPPLLIRSCNEAGILSIKILASPSLSPHNPARDSLLFAGYLALRSSDDSSWWHIIDDESRSSPAGLFRAAGMSSLRM
jgi:hypothetical protein